jgi:putative aldouronate transport system permease protein
MRGTTIGEKTFTAANGVLLGALVLVTLYPMLYVLFASVSNSNELIMHSGLLVAPLGFNLGAYRLVFRNPMILRGYLNTTFIVGVGTLLNLGMTSLGAFFLSRKNVLWRNAVMVFIVLTMFFDGGMIPFFLTVKRLGLVNHLWSIILPFSINTFYLIIMRTSFAAIPDSLEESAKIDGANELVVLTKIILPVSIPVLAVMALYYGVDRWNNWFYAMVFLQDRSQFPLALVLREILILNSTESMTAGMSSFEQASVGEAVKYATIIVATLPILFIYPLLQRYFVKGIMVGALKE